MISVEIRGFGRRPWGIGNEETQIARELWGHGDWNVVRGEKIGLSDEKRRILTTLIRVKQSLEILPFLDEIDIQINETYSIRADGRGNAVSLMVWGARDELAKIEETVEALKKIPYPIGIFLLDKTLSPFPRVTQRKKSELEMFLMNDAMALLVQAKNNAIDGITQVWHRVREFRKRNKEEWALELAKKERHIQKLTVLVIYLIWWVGVLIQELKDQKTRPRQ